MSLRPGILERGQRLRARVAIGLIGLVSRTKPDDIARIMLYRPGFFGRHFLGLMREVMRGSSDWTVGERELLAAFVSRRNACRFCAGIHSQVATLASGRQVTIDDLDAWSDAPFDERLEAAMDLLAASLEPGSTPSPEDLSRARSAGVSDEAVADALHVAFLFNVINRLADTFGASHEGEEGRLRTAAGLYRMGYRVPSFFVR